MTLYIFTAASPPLPPQTRANNSADRGSSLSRDCFESTLCCSLSPVRELRWELYFFILKLFHSLHPACFGDLKPGIAWPRGKQF